MLIILLTRNLTFDPDIRQSSHLLMIPLHCFSSNYRTRGQFECDVLRFCFLFVLISFIHMDGVDAVHRLFTFSRHANKTG